MDRTRRALVASVGTALLAGLAGCGGGDGGGADGGTDQGPAASGDTETDTPTPTPSVETVVDDELHLQEGGYESWQFYVSGSFTLDYEFTVTEGSAIDVYVVEHRQLQHFEAQRVFESVVASEGAESDSVTQQLPEATYHLIVDHSVRGSTDPPGGLTQDPVDVQITATYTQDA